MLEILHREAVYLWYYFDIQLRQIFWYWIFGMVLGSAVSVFLKDHIHSAFRRKEAGHIWYCDCQCSGNCFAVVYVWQDSRCRFLF